MTILRRWTLYWLSWIGMVVLIAAGLLWLGLAMVAAQSGHGDFHREFYRHWKQPGSDKSCCNARVTAFGHEIGDCEPTAAEVRNGDWYAWNRLRGEWLRVPDSKILRERNPNIFDGHLCWTPESGVICFVPPNTGG